MKKIYEKKSKQCYTCIVLLLIVLISLSGFEAKAQALYISENNGYGMCCVGETKTYTLLNAVSGVNYTWNITPAGQNTIMTLPNNQVQIQWMNASGFQIIVTGNNNTSASSWEDVYEALNPFITTTSEVGCQLPARKESGNIILDNENGCVNVCENSTVLYHANSILPTWYIPSRFEWAVTGGVFYPSNTTTLTNSSFYSNQLTDVTVKWGPAGTGNITVTEFCEIDCTPKTKTICISKIETPIADFNVDNTSINLEAGEIYEICLNHEVNFTDLSTASPNSLILFWEWDFGDGSTTSALQHPSHIYATPGDYTVTLKVTNECGCVSYDYCMIRVLETSSPKIYCTAVECENNIAIYNTDAPCGEYVWIITGGNQISNQNEPEVTVKWDNIGPDGFGYVSLWNEPCEGGCPNNATLRVPVVKIVGTIDGLTTVCANSYYKYKLPAWPATDYTWDIINNNTGAIMQSFSENSHEIEINAGNTTGTFQIICNYVNTVTECAGTAIIDVYTRLQPVITAPKESCINSSITCSVSNPPSGSGITDWKVIKPNGSFFTQYSANNASSITLLSTIFNTIGTYTIYAINQANFCDPEPVTVKVVNPPAKPTAIIGDATVCLNYPYTYTVDALPNTIVNWTITGGVVSGTSATTATGNPVSINWNTTGTKMLTATRSWDHLPGCTSEGRIMPITHIVVSGTITKSPDPTPTVCEDATESFNLTLTNGLIGEFYEWSVYPAQMGSISLGQGTTSVNVTFNHIGTSSSCEVRCQVTKCGQNTLIYLPVTIQAATSITSLTPANTSIWSGMPVTYTATTAGANPASFIWDFGNGNTVTTTSNSVTPNPNYTNFNNGDNIYTVSVKVVSSCNSAVSAASFTTITIKPQPNASISPGGLTVICPPTDPFSLPTTISNTSTGTYTYKWYFLEEGTSLPAKVIAGTTFPTYTITNNLPNVTPAANSSFGTYWVVVTNTATGCTTKTNIKTVLSANNCNPSSCNAQGPAGITNFTTTLLNCGEVHANCTTLGTVGGNIVSFQWLLNGVNYQLNGTKNISPVYTISQPGIYQIQLIVTYKNATLGGPDCSTSKFGNILVPIIADFNWGMACNGTQNGYNLTLTDNSPVFGNMSVTSRVWKINNTVVGGGSPSFVHSLTPGTTITVELTVDNGSGHPCVKTQTIVVPALPLAAFSTLTKNDTYPYTKSCEGREVKFTNNSSPSGSIATNVWDFGDNTSLHAQHANRVYGISYPLNDFELKNVTLTVTDNFGCSKTATTSLNIERNNLSANTPSYILDPLTPPCSLTPVKITVNVNGGSPTAYQWYKETNQIQLTTISKISVINPGAYWVQLRDARYCYKNINPSPVAVSFKYPVQAVITGVQDVCDYEQFTLKGPGGNGLTYLWKRNPGNITCGTGQSITTNLPAGNYTFTLTVSQTGGCTSVSSPYQVTVHYMPQPPTTSFSVIDCNTYTIQLNASPGNNFTWSDGQSGAAIQVTHGGPYRVWLTDQYGCKSHADLNVPLAPSTHFWRFPVGCYSYCIDELPKWVNAPSHETFNYWEWLITTNGNTNIANPNNGLGGSGSQLCAPLWLDNYTGGESGGSGSGDYQWGLDNGLCYQQSGIMSVEMKEECCFVEMQNVNVYCNGIGYSMNLNFYNTANCNVSYYNIFILDPITKLPIVNTYQQNPAQLSQGFNQIYAEFPNSDIFINNPHILIKIETFCNNGEHCIGYIESDAEPCGYKSSEPIPFAPKAEATDYITQLNIVPNPASTEVNISYRFANDNLANNRSIQVYDATGRPVTEIKIGNASGVYKLNVSNYAQGIYFVEIRENNQHVLVKQIIINH